MKFTLSVGAWSHKNNQAPENLLVAALIRMVNEPS
jgi:hypothetical protein